MLDVIIGILVVIALAVGIYGLLDTWLVYREASAANLATYKPTSTGGASSPSFAELCAINDDVCAWLTVDGTSIDYPVVIGEDNYEYLNKSVLGEFSFSGSLFLDFRNSRDFSDSYTVIFGHHMEGEAMFGPLPSFLEADFFAQNTTGTLTVRDGEEHAVTWFACLYTDGYDSNVYRVTGGVDDEALAQLVEYLAANSRQYRDIGVGAGDRVIALSTCSDATTNGRVLLFGRLE